MTTPIRHKNVTVCLSGLVVGVLLGLAVANLQVVEPRLPAQSHGVGLNRVAVLKFQPPADEIQWPAAQPVSVLVVSTNSSLHEVIMLGLADPFALMPASNQSRVQFFQPPIASDMPDQVARIPELSLGLSQHRHPYHLIDTRVP